MRYYYQLKASNGDIILKGEGYATKQSGLDDIKLVKENANDDNSYIRSDDYLKYKFNLISKAGTIVGSSETYYSPIIREADISIVKRDAQIAIIKDLT